MRFILLLLLEHSLLFLFLDVYNFFFHKGRRRPTAIFEHLFHDLHLKKETTEYMCDEPKELLLKKRMAPFKDSRHKISQDCMSLLKEN